MPVVIVITTLIFAAIVDIAWRAYHNSDSLLSWTNFSYAFIAALMAFFSGRLKRKVQPMAEGFSSQTETQSPSPILTWEELHRRLSIVTRVRYRAAERLRHHYRLSQWIVALLSVGLVFASAWPITTSTVKVAEQVRAIQIVLSVLVLVYSLLLSMDNSMINSERMHKCSLELDALDRDLSCKQPTGDELHKYSQQYSSILDRYENHQRVDFLRNAIDDGRRKRRVAKSKGNETWLEHTKGDYVRDSIVAYLRAMLGYIHYVLVTIFVIASIIWLTLL